jgi:hypothetical protein
MMASLPNTKIEETHNLLFHRHINFCLASCPSCSVGCCISQRLSLSLSSRPARRLGLCCFSCLHLLSCLHLSLCPSCLVGCRIAQRLTPPHLVATPPDASDSPSCCTPLVQLVCYIAQCIAYCTDRGGTHKKKY